MAVRPARALQRERVITWGGFALGVVASPLALLLLSYVLTAFYGGLDVSGVYGVAIADARRLASALDRYRNRYQRIPSAKDGLARLVPEFLSEVPDDPWGRPYMYDPTGPDWADVLSYGADGRAGGAGEASDISARFGRLGPRPPGWLRSLVALVAMSLPLAAAAGMTQRRWCATALAGIAAFWGVMLLATVGGGMQTILPPLSFAAGLACLTASIALLRELPKARIVALIAVAAAFMLLFHLVSG